MAADLEALLTRTSRTFALSIPRLPSPTREAVTLAYLLFRIADTFEDAAAWPRAARIEALDEFVTLLRDPGLVRDGIPPGRSGELCPRWVAARPVDHEGYLELLAETPAVLSQLAGLSLTSRGAVLEHTVRTAEGMKGFVRESTEAGGLALHDIEALRGYCYVVAGIVGEMLTELFLADAPAIAASAEALRARARAFGEGLQLVNIVKDAGDDARDGRVYLPAEVPRATVFGLARADLERAAEYVTELQHAGAPRGYVEFTALPVLLARATLDAVERDGPGAKVPRELVMTAVSELDRRLDEGAPALG